MARLSDLYGRRLAARQRQIDQNRRDIRDLLARVQREVLSVNYPPASLPGEAPRRRTGRLRAEADVVITAAGNFRFVNTAPYARHLLLGTSRIRPRPWQDITLDRARPELDRLERRGMPFGGEQ